MQPFGKKINGNISHIFARQRVLVELLQVLNILESTRVKELPKASPPGPSLGLCSGPALKPWDPLPNTGAPSDFKFLIRPRYLCVSNVNVCCSRPNGRIIKHYMFKIWNLPAVKFINIYPIILHSTSTASIYHKDE